MASAGYDDLVEFDPAVRVMENVLKLCDEKKADPAIRQKVEIAIQLIKDRGAYCEKVSTEPSPALQTLASETRTYPFDKAFEEGKTKWKLSTAMMSGGLEGKFLQSIIMMNRAKRVLEIGMFTGYAALSCAEVLPEDGEVVTCEFDPFLKEVARGFFNNSSHGNKIDIRVGPADETLQALAKEGRPFDVIFIDANKDGYKGYYKTIMSENLLSAQGVIAFDNCLYHGLTYCIDEDSNTNRVSEMLREGQIRNGKCIKELNDYLMTQDDIFRVLLPIRDGVLLVQRKPKGM